MATRHSTRLAIIISARIDLGLTLTDGSRRIRSASTDRRADSTPDVGLNVGTGRALAGFSGSGLDRMNRMDGIRSRVDLLLMVSGVGDVRGAVVSAIGEQQP